MLAAVVVERLDQRGACRHGRLAAERVVGEADQIMRAVGQALGASRRVLAESLHVPN